VRGPDAWHERLVACQDTLFLPIRGKQVPDDLVPADLRSAAPGSIIETSPASVAIARFLAKRIAAQGGAGLIIDYGYQGPAIGETLQAVKNHAFANPFEAPGDFDLSAHVDFATLAAIAALADVYIAGPVPQGQFLETLGISTRAGALAKASPERAAEIKAACARLTHPEAMGALFKAMALSALHWPVPAGFG
jgi:NADH dehydrogenase [ubiquinone] 1 alpha subcomplex assembly factor 7